MKKLLPLLLILSGCVHSQQVKLGGTGGAGGTAGFQTSSSRLVITVQSLPDATANSAYSQTLTAVNGANPLPWSVLLGSLPPGLTLNSATGAISGTPTTPGNYSFTILVTDSTSPTAKTATQDLSIAVNCPGLSITSPTVLPPAAQGTDYKFQFTSAGGLGSITWTSTGTLPTGITLSAGGLLSGTPSVAGTFTPTVSAIDSCPLTAQTASNQFSLLVNSSVLITTTSPLPDGTAGSAYSVQFAASGGTAPYTWTNTGSLPTGLSLASDGTLSGTPTVSGTFTFVINVADSGSGTNSAVFTITINCPPLSVVTSTVPNGVQGQPYSAQLVPAGGFGTKTWAATGTLPTGVTLSTAGLLSGTPTTTGTFDFTATVTDSCTSVQTASQDFTVTISPGLQITTTSPLAQAVQGQAYNATMTATGGTPPYQWTVPASPVPAGAEDILTYALMPVGTRSNFHLSATGLYKAFRLDAGLFWWMKNSQGFPSDGEVYDGSSVNQWFTEMDSSQDAACQAEGWPNCFNDPEAYKRYQTPVSLWARYHVPGATDTIVNPGPNLYDLTTNCGADNQTPIDNKTVIGTLTGPFTDVTWQTTYGGNIPDNTPYLLAQKWIKCTGNTANTCTNEEDYWLVKGYGQARWCPKTWNGTTFVTGTCTTQTNVVAGGAPVPNFACKVPTIPISGNLPPGVTSTSAPQMDLAANTGVISGTPSQSGTYGMTVQVQDAAGTITQGNFTLNVTCPALSILSTSPLPLATQGQAYSFTFLPAGGVAPIVWTKAGGSLPAGLSISAAGVLSGTPTQTGVFLFSVQAQDSCAPTGQRQQQNYSLSVQANSGPLTIQTASPLQGATEGSAYSQQITATGGTTPYTFTISAGAIPAGMTFSSAGLLSGTPTTVQNANFTVRVTDALSGTTTKAFTLAVSCPALSLVSTSPLPNGLENTAYSFQFQASGGILPYTFTRTAGSFPAGLSLSTAGALTGTPTANGAFSATVQVADSCVATPQTASQSYSLTIAAPPPPLAIATTSPLPDGTVNQSYSTTMNATGGTAPYFWSITSGALPAGLSLNSSTGAITGTPTTAGTSTPTIQVTDSLGATASGSFSITVSCPALSLTSAVTLPQGTQNSPYSFQFTASGGIGPYTFTLVSGTLPTGVTLSSGGLLSGTPTNSGTFGSLVVKVTDSCSTPQNQQNTFTLTIVPATPPLQITTTSPLPSGTQNGSYSTTMSATGGTPPYTWSITVGTLPTGLTLHAATGVIDGTPTGTGTSTITIQVTDSVPANASGSFSITINPASGADNRYCNPNGTWIGATTDDVAALPTACNYTPLSATPASGPTKTVCASGCDFTTVNAALTAASCGWIIQVKALSGTSQATYSGFTLPAKSCTASNWIIIETDKINAAGMAPEGTRITPAYVGIPSLPGRPPYGQPSTGAGIFLPKIICGASNCIDRATNANFYRLIGLEVTTNSGVTVTDITRTTNTDNITWDRILIHGGNSATGQSRDNVTRAFDWQQSTHQSLIDSYCYDIHTANPGSQCLNMGGISSTTEGPFKLVNNFLEAADSFSAVGGGGVGTTTKTPQNFEIRRNHFWKPLFWKSNDPTYFGTKFTIKNCIDWKNAQKAIFEGNICENSWGQQGDQPGPLAEWGAKNQSSFTSGTATSSGNTLTAKTGTFPASVVSPNCATPNQCVVKFNGVKYKAQTRIDSTHVTVSPTPPTTTSPASFTAYAPGLNPNATVADITIRYNIFRHGSRCLEMFSAGSDGNDVGLFTGRFSVHDNVCDDIDGFKWNLSSGACCGWSVGIYVDNEFPSPKYMDKLTFNHNTILTHLTGGSVGSGPSLGFGSQTSSTGWIGHLKFTNNISAAGLGRAATGVCTGSSTALGNLQCWDKLNGIAQNTFCFDTNALATTTLGSPSGTANDPPYPAAGDSHGCGFVTTGNSLPASYAAIGFTNLNGANGGNYLLLNTSPLHNAGSDGLDLGANINLVNTATAGVN